MKHTLPFIAIGAGLAASIIVAAASFAKSQPSAGEPWAFVRPDFVEAPAPTPAAIDISKRVAFTNSLSRAKLRNDLGACYAALDRVGVDYKELEATHTEEGCGYENAIELRMSSVAYTAPEPLVTTCAMAARLYLWEQDIVAPAALKHLGSELTGVEAFGGYSCRKVAHTDKLSEHSFAKAADIKGFKLADGRVISILDSYGTDTPAGAFLKEIHDQACSIFDVTLGPDYNADHANHFHIDVGGQSACR